MTPAGRPRRLQRFKNLGEADKMNPVVASDTLERTTVWAEDDPTVRWSGAFALYGTHGTTQSSTIVYEIEPGKRLGWHTDATEETQYIIAGTGELKMEDGTTPSGRTRQRLRPADAGPARSREHRHRDLAGRCLLRGGDVHADLRQCDAAAEIACPRNAQPSGLSSGGMQQVWVVRSTPGTAPG